MTGGEASTAGRALYFTGPRRVETRPVEVGPPAADEVLVETHVSAISPGTELLVYRGQAPAELTADETIDTLAGDLSFPVKYGYAAVGEVTAVGSDADPAWDGRTVLAFHPHQTRFRASPESLVEVPPDVRPDRAALLPTVETATNFALDASPRIGERVVVFGAGVVGLCTTRLLAAFPLEALVVADPIEDRREVAREMGADVAVEPAAVDDELPGDGADLAVEVSGQPSTLDDAIDAVGFDGRVVVGSWYGTKRAPVDLGGRFHRDRIELISSQVSTVEPSLRGRWSKDRRLDTALDWLGRVDADALVTHRVPFGRAPTAYETLDEQPETALQVLLTYR